MTVLSPETWSTVRELLGRWLADPDADLEAAISWCEDWVASRPYALGDDPTLPWRIAVAYARAHPAKLDRLTRVLGGFRES